MESGQKPRKFAKLSRLVNPKSKPSAANPDSPQLASLQSGQEDIHNVDEQFSDRQQVKDRYVQAATLLQEAVKTHKTQGESFDFPNLSGEMEQFNGSEFRNKMNMAMANHKNSIKNQRAWGKCGDVIQCVFTALSPFAQNFLLIARDNTSVESVWITLQRSPLIDPGIIIFQSIVNRSGEGEIERRTDVAKTFEYVCQQLRRLEVVTKIPDNLEQHDYVINRAMDVRSASMWYLAMQICHDATPLGTFGRTFKTFFIGDKKISDPTNWLKVAVDSYNESLCDAHLQIGIKAYELLKDIAELQRENQIEKEKRIENKFMIPYQRNPQFIGRIEFLEALKERLFSSIPKQYNHRIALYGMAGVGKTQTALEYVYFNEASYERIYWISAMDQTSLLSGYQKIAEEVEIVIQSSNLLDVSKAVLRWLRGIKSWLLVIDNLDDITIADGLIPENGPENHTLITTRNPNSEGIPAEGLEVPLFDHKEAMTLLSIRSKIDILPDSPEEEQAEMIVKELHYLPLAIEQAAAYIRMIAGDFAVYREEYHKDRKGMNQWMPPGNKQYPYSVAKTFSISFNIVKNIHPQAANLLRLMSFLNPDGILIEFLVAGVDGLESGLRNIISVPNELAKALLELETFSLIRWDRKNKTISLHRLTQTVIIDGMTSDETACIYAEMVRLIARSFPVDHTNETRALCRRYQGQVLEPLLRMDSILEKNAAWIKWRVANFLHDDGKYVDSEKLLQQAVKILTQLLGLEHPDTLGAMNNLGSMYGQMGRAVEAAKLQEEVLEKRTRILGEEHPHTLGAVSNLGSTYGRMGRTVEAARLHEKVLEKFKRILGEEHSDTLRAMNNLVSTYLELGHVVEATRLQEEALEKYTRILGEEHPDTLRAMNNLGWAYGQMGRAVEAAKLQEEVLEKRTRILGEEHPDTLGAMDNLSWMYGQMGRGVEAVRLHEKVLEKRTRILGEEHPDTLQAMNCLGSTYQEMGRAVEAARLQEEVLAKRTRILGEEHPHTLHAMDDLGWTYGQMGRAIEAARLHKEVLEKYSRILGEEHPDTLRAIDNLGWAYGQMGRAVEAAKLHKEVLEKRTRVLGEEHPDTLRAKENLGWAYGQMGLAVEVAKLQEEVLENRTRILGEKRRDALGAMNNHPEALRAEAS